MSYTIIEQDLYLKALKKLSKKYKLIENEIHLIYIYTKSSLENISEKELDTLLLKQL